MDCQKQSSKWTLIFFSILLLGSVSYFTFSYFPIESAKINVEMTRWPQMASPSVTNHSGLSSLLNVLKCPMASKKVETSDEPLLTILLWTWPLGYQFPLNKCPNSENSGCFYTVNRSMYSMADAVVISHQDVSRSEELLPPAVRPPHQYWIWFSMESPTNCPNLALMDNKINLTMSYRLDSDIHIPTGRLEDVNGKENFTIPKKTKLVAWVVSNWRPEYRRTKYYQELKKYIPVDVYGEHGLPLPQNDMLETLSMYKFYLAFENSVHEDYITEKFWRNSLKSGEICSIFYATGQSRRAGVACSSSRSPCSPPPHVCVYTVTCACQAPEPPGTWCIYRPLVEAYLYPAPFLQCIHGTWNFVAYTYGVDLLFFQDRRLGRHLLAGVQKTQPGIFL